MFLQFQLGWDYEVQEWLHLDTFEDKKSKEWSKDFQWGKKHTRLEQKNTLHELGVTKKEIQEATKRATLIRNNHRKSIEMIKHDENTRKQRTVGGN